jgi:hypothetical protein
MKQINIIVIIMLAALLGGCSTGKFLKPEAPSGSYNRENPSCPGAEKVLEFSPPGEDWIEFRILAKLPNKYSPEGTRLIAYFRFVYGQWPSSVGAWARLFPNKGQASDHKKLVNKRKNKKYLVTSSSSMATIRLSDGTETKVSLPFFEEPFDGATGKYYGSWGPEVVIYPGSLEKFTVVLPDIFLNGEKMDIPEIKFKLDQHYYAPVLNC